jgi:two-component system, LytTR family, response regulator
MPRTVFVTAHNEYAVGAFDVHAIDYLVKPIQRKRLDAAMARVKERIRLDEAFAARKEISLVLEALRNGAEKDNYPRHFLTKSGNTSSLVNAGDIEWVEAADYYVCLHAKGKTHLMRESIAAMESKLDPSRFVRLHRSAIVNIDHVREIHRDGRAEGWALLSTGERVRLNRTGWKKLTAMQGMAGI